MKSFTALLLLPLLFALGCASAPPKPKYTVFTPDCRMQLPGDYTSLSVRLADDIRSAPHPLCFHADGTVTLCRELAYYAPIEVALTRALQDTFSLRKAETTPAKTLRLVVRTFGVDARSGTPKAVVHLDLPSAGLEARVEAPLAETYTAHDLRNALGAALLQSVGNICTALAPPAETP